MQKEVYPFSGGSPEPSSLATRLLSSLKEAGADFVRNPRSYARNALKRDAWGDSNRRNRLRLGFAMAFTAYVAVILAAIGAWYLGQHARRMFHNSAIVRLTPPLFTPGSPTREEQPPVRDNARAGGGGGGGNNDPGPASQGAPPLFAEQNPIIAPTTSPQLQPPSLPVPETLQVDPRFQPPRDESIVGLVAGVPGPPSDGPGTGGGIGNGNKGGVGPGDGPGVGPGANGGIGDGPYRPGGNRPEDPPAGPLSSGPRALNHPRPNYTEEARKNKVQGVVQLRVWIDASGRVTEVKTLSNLRYGLDEEAIKAAHEMKFVPAMAGGRAVGCWVTMEIEFNLR
jgi:TonB family protein